MTNVIGPLLCRGLRIENRDGRGRRGIEGTTNGKEGSSGETGGVADACWGSRAVAFLTRIGDAGEMRKWDMRNHVKSIRVRIARVSRVG